MAGGVPWSSFHELKTFHLGGKFVQTHAVPREGKTVHSMGKHSFDKLSCLEGAQTEVSGKDILQVEHPAGSAVHVLRVQVGGPKTMSGRQISP